MNYRNDTLDQIKILIQNCLSQLYDNDRFLFERNNNRGISERGLVFRFAYYLQNEIEDFYVDCDFNSSFEHHINEHGDQLSTEMSGKEIKNQDGTITKRFIDIIVHKRDFQTNSDYICFEFKKWNNNKAFEREKDFNNLRRLTSDYGYKFGFHIVLGKTMNDTRWTIFWNGGEVESNSLVFKNM